MERELKLVLDAPGYLRLASSLAAYAGQHRLANHYFDSAGHALLSKGAMLRIRETEQGWIVGLKQGVPARGGQFAAAEREEPLTPDDWRRLVRAGGDLRILQHPVIGEAFTLAGVPALPYLGGLRVVRKTYHLGGVVDLELDLTCFEDGSQDWELEVETERPEDVRPYVEELLSRRGVLVHEQTRTKFERFLGRARLEAPELCATDDGEVVRVDAGLVVRRRPLLGTAVFASRGFAAGEPLFTLDGEIVERMLPPSRGRRWIQIGPGAFLDVRGTIAPHVNHSCLPNAGIRGLRTLVALRPIRAGEEVTYDYAMTEWELERVCCCGTVACRGLVGGYRRLPGRVKEAYAGWVSEYLQAMSSTGG